MLPKMVSKTLLLNRYLKKFLGPPMKVKLPPFPWNPIIHAYCPPERGLEEKMNFCDKKDKRMLKTA